MRLLTIAAVNHPGGAEIHLLRLLEGLKRRGWEITLSTPGPGPLRDTALGRGFGWAALTVGGLGRFMGAPAIRSWPKARRLARELDVIYLNGGVCGRVLPALPGGAAKRVLHLHDIPPRMPGHWRRADVVLADSAAVAAKVPQLSPHVVYGPVEPNPPEAKAPWGTGNGPVIGFIGRVEPRKGTLDLVRAAPAIRESIPNARVVIVGDDPYRSDPRYTSEVLSSRDVEHHAWRADAPGLMRHLDVLVLPSYREPFGTVLAEAMAVGTPVVATNVDGLKEVVEDGVTGRLVSPGSPEDLAQAVVQVLANRRQMGDAAREHAHRFWTEAYVDRVERLITP